MIELFQDLLLFCAFMATMLVIASIVVSKLPDDNPLKRILTALCSRLGMTLGAGVFAIPIEVIPGIDALYDIGMPLFLAYYWFTFFREIYRAGLTTPKPSVVTPAEPPTIDMEPQQGQALMPMPSYDRQVYPPPQSSYPAE